MAGSGGVAPGRAGAAQRLISLSRYVMSVPNGSVGRRTGGDR